MDAYGVLVIILSVTLAVLLVASIILVVVLIKLANQIRDITARAEDIMDDVEAVSGFFRKTAGPVAITSMLSNIISKVTQYGKRSKSKDE